MKVQRRKHHNNLFLFVLLIAIISISLFYLYPLYRQKTEAKVTATLTTEVTQYPLTFSGKIPEWLTGTFVRNGPIAVEINGQTTHWFDGPAMLHGFTFREGKITYSNKFLRSDVYKTIFVDKSLNFAGFAEKGSTSFWKKTANFFQNSFDSLFNRNDKNRKFPIQNANVNVGKIAGIPIAVTETPLPVRFDLQTMDTLGVLNFEDDLPKENVFESAHMLEDLVAKEQINYLVEYGRESFYVIYRLNLKIPKREVIGKIPVEKPAYMHSFGLSQNYIILVEFPFVVNPIDLMIGNKAFIKNFKWEPERGTNFLIVDRKTGQLVQKINNPTAFFAFHHVNAFEEDGKIILDIITYPDAKVITAIKDQGENEYHDTNGHDATINPYKTKLMRYTILLNEGSIDSKIMIDAAVEFPRINSHFTAHPYRYAYMMDATLLKNPNDIKPIYKYDTQTGSKVTWQEPGLLPGEPVFIPKPNANNMNSDMNSEEDGVIVTIMLEPARERAFLLMLDAKTFQEIGRAYAPHTIPIGLHGQFFDKLQ